MSFHRIRTLCVLATLLLTASDPTIAQEDTTFSDIGFWLQGGMGFTRGSVQKDAYDFGASLSYKGVWTIRLVSASTRKDVSPEEVISISAMYGFRTHTKHIMAMFSAGPSHTRISTPHVKGTAIGLVVEGEIMFRPIQIIGLGLRMSENLNSKGSYFAGGLFLEFGVLWQ